MVDSSIVQPVYDFTAEYRRDLANGVYTVSETLVHARGGMEALVHLNSAPHDFNNWIEETETFIKELEAL